MALAKKLAAACIMCAGICAAAAQDAAEESMVLDPATVAIGPRENPFGFGAPEKAWPRAGIDSVTISVCWWHEGDEKFEEEMQIVRQAVLETWSAAAPVVFTGWGDCALEKSEVRIRIADTIPHTLGLGTDIRGKDAAFVMNFDLVAWQPIPWCMESEDNRLECIKAIAVHEFGHVLGLAHEQNRTDTDVERCHEMPAGPDGTKELTPWDKDSVMNYCNPIYRQNGWKLSEKDKQSIRTLYEL